MVKRLFLMLLVILLGNCIISAPAGAAAKVWKLGHTLPKDTPEGMAIEDFAKRVGELSNGSISIRVFPAMQLGDWTVMQQRVSLGALEMATQPPSSQVDKRISFLYFPYLFKNVDMLRKNLAQGSAFRTELDKLFIGQNIYPVTYIPLFFGGVGAKRLPDNWDAPKKPKNLKLRIPNDPSFALHAEEMGYQATPIPMSDTFTALQTNIIDGVLGFGAMGNFVNYKDLIKYYIPLNDFIQLWPVMINLKLWEGLTDAQRKAITQASHELEDRRYKEFMDLDADYRKKLKDAGITVMDVTPEIISAFADTAKKECWPALADKIDKDWITNTLSKIVQ